MDLSKISTRDLASALLKRGDLRRSDGWLEPEVWDLRCALGPNATVDGIPIKERVKLGLIVRNTGPCAGKLCFVGGIVFPDETLEEALRRHFRTDLNAEIEILDPEWDQPFRVWAYHSWSKFGATLLTHDPVKHSISSTFLVKIKDGWNMRLGSSEVGGQEVREFKWFAIDSLPREEDLGYGISRRMLRKALITAARLSLEQ